MSDPRYTDPRPSEPPRDDLNTQRLGEVEKSNSMWGWIAGGIVLALLLVFIFGRAPNSPDTASNDMSPTNPAPATTVPPAAQAPSMTPTPPATTGQGVGQGTGQSAQ